MERESGFYWVKYDNKWEVAEFGGDGLGGFWWMRTGDECDYGTDEMDEIGERINPPTGDK